LLFLFIAFVADISSVNVSARDGLQVVATASAAETQNEMEQVSLIIKKLRTSMSSLNDLDELEKAGMPQKDVDRMRTALQGKIQQMISEALLRINAL